MKLKIIFKIIYYLIRLNCTKSNTREILKKYENRKIEENEKFKVDVVIVKFVAITNFVFLFLDYFVYS